MKMKMTTMMEEEQLVVLLLNPTLSLFLFLSSLVPFDTYKILIVPKDLIFSVY